MADDEKKRDELQKYLDAILPLYSTYHNHKENMAHLALAAQIVLACAVFSGKLSLFCYLHQFLLLSAVIVLWIALYLYAGWEMWLRRVAATVTGAIIRARGKIITHEHNKDIVQTNEWRVNYCKWVWLPWYCINNMYDREFPEELMFEIKEVVAKGDKHLDYLEIGSWILSLCILAVYILKFISLIIICSVVYLMNSCNRW